MLLLIGPALLFVGGEALLRLSGYGYPTSFFIPAQDGRHLTSNRRFGWQFMRRETATQPCAVMMPVHKEPGTRRIFVLGESAAQGTPDPAFGFARILEVMLNRQFPGKKFEIINAAMRGINSHAILPIARECAGHEPDLFLIYMGNNETVGLHSPNARGFSLTPHRRLIRLTQWLKTTKWAQLVRDLARSVRKSNAQHPVQDMAFFRQNRLAFDDPRRAAVYENFRANLADICRATRMSGAKTIVATVAVNLKDFPPLASLHRRGLSKAEESKWDGTSVQGVSAEAEGRTLDAISNYVQAAQVDNHYAELHFRLARCCLAVGQADLARENFKQARDWEALQFRTDGRQNEIIRTCVASRQEAGAVLVDAERAFATNSEHGLPGSQFFQEHVHFTFDGDYLLARTFLPAVAQALGLSGAVTNMPSRAECAADLAFTEWDEINVTAASLRMTAKPPFLDQVDHAARQAKGEQFLQARSLAFQQQGGYPRGREIYQGAVARRPDDWMIRLNFGNYLSDFGDHAGAIDQYRAAIKSMPTFLPLRVSLAQELVNTGQNNQAITELQTALKMEPSYAPARQALEKMSGRRGR